MKDDSVGGLTLNMTTTESYFGPSRDRHKPNRVCCVPEYISWSAMGKDDEVLPDSQDDTMDFLGRDFSPLHEQHPLSKYRLFGFLRNKEERVAAETIPEWHIYILLTLFL
jgi:hypothetical protein